MKKFMLLNVGTCRCGTCDQVAVFANIEVDDKGEPMPEAYRKLVEYLTRRR